MRLDPMSSACTRPRRSPLHRQLGLTDDELAAIVELLGREPTELELAMYAVMWSEHCSYKSSKRHLGRFPTEAPWVLVGPGEGAGVDRRRRRPRGGDPHREPQPPVRGRALPGRGHRRRRHHPRHLLHGRAPDRADGPAALRPARRRPHPLPVRGRGRRASAATATRSGVPTVGGEVVFDDCYRDNPLVNVLCLGLLPGRAARAREGRGRRQPRGAARLVHRARRHRRRERARVGRLRRGLRGQATVGAGRRPVRGEAAHRGVPRAARRRPRRSACRTSAPPASRARRRRPRRRPARAWTSTSPACPSASRA